MAATVTDNRTIVDEADGTTNWTGSVTMSVVTADPAPVESTGCIGQRNNSTTTDAYRGSLTAINFNSGQSPGPSLVYVWVFPRTVPDLKANGGIGIQLGDGTNRVAFHVGGVDESGFRHETGPTLWQCFVLDTAKAALAAAGGGQYTMTVKAGSAASLNFGAITQIGYQLSATVAAQGNVPNTYVDIIRRAAVGVGLTITGASGVWTDVTAADKAIGNQQAFGVVRVLATGVYGCQGNIRIGDASGSANTTFSMTNESLVFPGFTVDTDKYQVILQQGGSGATTVTISGSVLYCPAGIGAKFDAGGSGTINLAVTNSTFFGFSQGILFKAGHTISTTIISNCGMVTAPGTDMRTSSVLSSVVAADAAALLWNVNTNTDGKLDSMTFSKGTAAHHAIELGTSAATTITLRGITFTGFNASDGQNDSVLLLDDRGSNTTWNISTVGCVGTVSYKKVRSGDTVNIIPDTKVLTVHVQDAVSGAAITGARVLALAAAGGPYPYQATVSIARTGSTATVTHNSHGLSDGQQVVIEGCNEGEYNGLFTITYIGVNSYSYPVSGTPATPAGGSPKSTFVIVTNTTSSGNLSSTARAYSSSQPYSGRVRYAPGTPPNYRSTPFGGTVSAATQTVVVQMVSDD